jgi:CheY-like chemotaxis protein
MLPESKPEPVAACVLLVEDAVALRVWIAEELRDTGFTVIEAKNADEANAIVDSGGGVRLVLDVDDRIFGQQAHAGSRECLDVGECRSPEDKAH